MLANVEEVPAPRPDGRSPLAAAGRGTDRLSGGVLGRVAAGLPADPDERHGWYALADKAPWTPPGWIFGSVWLVLYAAVAVAAWLVWRQRPFPRRAALKVYGVLLLLNLAWPLMFFGLYPMMGTAALWLALLVLGAHAVAATLAVLHFGPISRTAGLLMLPYVSWLVFSASLNLYAAVSN